MSRNNLIALSNEIRIFSALLLKFFNQGLEERLKANGESINSMQYGILQMVRSETLTISILSQRTGMDPSSLVRSIDTLERKGLIKRGSDPKDRRRNPLHITEKGSDLLNQVPAISETDLSFQAIQSIGSDSANEVREQLASLIRQFPEGKMVTNMMDQLPPMSLKNETSENVNNV